MSWLHDRLHPITDESESKGGESGGPEPSHIASSTSSARR